MIVFAWSDLSRVKLRLIKSYFGSWQPALTATGASTLRRWHLAGGFLAATGRKSVARPTDSATTTTSIPSRGMELVLYSCATTLRHSCSSLVTSNSSNGDKARVCRTRRTRQRAPVTGSRSVLSAAPSALVCGMLSMLHSAVAQRNRGKATSQH